ncbi:AsmA family protein [Acidisoma sp. C75]
MSRRAWLLAAVAVLILLPLGLLGTAVTLFDPNDWKPEIEAVVQKATGRQLIIAGPIHVSRSLWPVIEATGVTLGNLPGGSRPDMIRLDGFKARVSLLALLWRQVDITDLTLIGPNILFEEVDHRPNWLFKPEGAAPAAPAPKPPAAARGFTLALHTVRITNGMVTFRLPARTNVIGIRQLDIRQAQKHGPVRLTSTLVYGDYAPFTLNFAATPTGRPSDPWNATLDFAGEGATAHAAGQVSLGGDFDLSVRAAAPALDRLNALYAPMRLPPVQGLSFATEIRNGPQRGDIPVIGKTALAFTGADLTRLIPGLTLGAVHVTLDKPGGTARFDGAGAYQKTPFTLAGAIGVPQHLDGPNRVPVTLKATALATDPARLALSGDLALDTTAFAGFDGAVSLSAPELARLRRLISPGLPALTHAGFEGHVSIPSDLKRLSITGGHLAAREADIAGDASFGLGGGVDVSAKLTATRLDLDALLRALGISLGQPAGETSAARAKAAAARARGPVFSRAALPWASLRGPVLAVSAAIQAMTFQGQAWRNVGLSVHLKDGRLAIDRMGIGLPGGPLEMGLTANAAARVPQLHLSLHAPDLPLGFVIYRLHLPGPAAGRLAVNAELSAAGESPHDLAASLSGSLAARMGAGSISNAALRMIAGAALSALSIQVPASGQAAIRCLSLAGRFEKGIGEFSQIALNSTYLNVQGAGQVDFGREQVALRLHPQAEVAGARVSVPVVVAGPFRDVSGKLDAGLLQKVGFLLDGLFGGDHPRGCGG